MNKSYFAYIRVSTKKQGDGASLAEQRAAIEAFARSHDLNIVRWFCELRTAAKTGRREFSEMVRELKRHRAHGVIIHKIDRSARNGRDWIEVSDLVDHGIDVRFAHNDLDLTTRAGRLTADLLAVIAADFIRNNREEVKKCMDGWLKQGHYPWPPPPGYQKQGSQRLKTIDPAMGPIVANAFKLYDSGRFSVETLREEVTRRGLRSRTGKPLAVDAVAKMLRNPFYIGVIRIQRTGETYEGKHDPLVSRKLFARVQARLDGRVFPRSTAKEFRFRRLIGCRSCGRTLTAERQKGHVYYRCHGRSCRGVSLSEATIETQVIVPLLSALEFQEEELGDIRDIAAGVIARQRQDEAAHRILCERDLGKVAERLERLTDALVDGVLEKEDFAERKRSLLQERERLMDARDGDPEKIWRNVIAEFERGNAAKTEYILANDAKKREILISLGSNFSVSGKEIGIRLHSPFGEVLEMVNSRNSGPSQGHVRTERWPLDDLQTLLVALASRDLGGASAPI